MVKKNIETTKKQVDQACEFIRSQITSGEISTDGKIPAVRKLGEQTGFQRNTVWRALLQLKEERFVVSSPNGRYQVHPRFKLNKKGSKKLLTAFIGDGTNELSSTFIQMVYNSLDSNQIGFNIDLHLFLRNENIDLKKVLDKFDAVILASGMAFAYYESLRKKGKYVTSLAAPNSCHIPCAVNIDNFRGGESAGEILTQSNIKSTILLGESPFPDSWQETFELRVIGFKRSWLQSGRLSKEIKEYPLPVELKSRTKKIEKIVSENDEFTGYFALSDSTGIILLNALKEEGIKIPEEAIVLGFDDTPEADKAELSSLHPDPDLMAEKLILQIRTQESEPNYSETIYVNPCFIERKSTKKNYSK